MAIFKNSVALILFLVILLQLLHPTHPRPHQFMDVVPQGPRAEYQITFKPSENYIEVDVKNISKALWNTGYKIMSVILENQLSKIVPYGTISKSKKERTDVVTIFNNNTITIFAPPDEAFRFEDWIVLDYQLVTSKVDKETFDKGAITKGSNLLTCDLHYDLIVSEVPAAADQIGYPSINNVRITQWDLYNDGHILIHGVQNFFNPHYFVCQLREKYKSVISSWTGLPADC